MRTHTDSFAAEVAAHRPHLERLGRRLTRDRDEAEDLVQEAVLRALMHRGSYEVGTNLRAWLARILRNAFLDGRRRAATHVRSEARLVAEEALRADLSPEVAVDLGRRAREVRAALDAIPSAFRDAVVRVDCQGEDYASAARALGCPEGTVMSRVFRGRRRLFELLANLEEPMLPAFA